MIFFVLAILSYHFCQLRLTLNNKEYIKSCIIKFMNLYFLEDNTKGYCFWQPAIHPGPWKSCIAGKGGILISLNPWPLPAQM
jgi:hypothetical protein